MSVVQSIDDKLILESPGNRREIFVGDLPLLIGREPSCAIPLNDTLVSRNHARIERREGGVAITDLGSANGTCVNGSKITESLLLDGDMVSIGETTLTYRKGKERETGTRDVQASVEVEEAVEEIQRSIVLPAMGRGGGRRQDAMFSILFNVGKAVSAAATLSEMIEKAMGLVFSAIDAERGIALFIEGSSGQLMPKCVRHRHREKVAPEEIKVSSTIVRKVLADKVAVITSDAKRDERFSEGLSIRQMNIRSALCVPLWEEGEIFGIVYLDNLADSHRFTNDDMVLLTAIGNLIAIRLRHERLNEKLQRETALRTNLARYHSPDVVELLVSRWQTGDIALEEREVTVLFVDIAESTRLAEQLSPADFAALLNGFFDLSVAAIFANGGHVNKFIGDCVMAIFNAPLDVEAHAQKAIRSAMEIVAGVRRRAAVAGERVPYGVHIGINTGRALVGNIGTESRKEYTVIGDVVNTAARLSKLDRTNEAVVSEATLQSAGGDVRAERMGDIQLKGKEQALAVYRIC
ncbi:MAG: hypothetical protein A2Z34_10155 [Planctomycetes bacterium RBG_16_59_8]|nr:MAG: hypothetical protein A2Z34_10155 [Planctomycetes bacterium RBG_16_59_8]